VEFNAPPDTIRQRSFQRQNSRHRLDTTVPTATMSLGTKPTEMVMIQPNCVESTFKSQYRDGVVVPEVQRKSPLRSFQLLVLHIKSRQPCHQG